jgi:hypothetical protein
MGRFYGVFAFSHQHFLYFLLKLRDDISGTATSRGLTTWDLYHRAGPAPLERAPRPSSADE